MSSPQEISLGPGRNLIRFDRFEAEIAKTGDRLRLMSDKGFQRRLFAALDGILMSPDAPPGLLSLDVFDTLLLRDGSSELCRFLEIGQAMADVAGAGFSGLDGFVARHLGTRASYRSGPRVDGCGEGSLSEIHLAAARLLGVPDAMADRFVEAELDHEARRVTANPLLVAYMKRHRGRGGKVVLISDMYMHAPQIAALLRRCGIARRSYDALYSSADTKISKASGHLFGHIPEAGGPGTVLHLGDSLHGDYRMPRAAGWQAMLLPVPDALLAERRADRLRCLHDLQTAHGLYLEAECAA